MLIILLSLAATAQEKFSNQLFNSARRNSAALTRTIDILHYDVRLRIDPNQKLLHGLTKLTIRSLSEDLTQFQLDLRKLAVNSLQVNDRTAAFQQSAGILYISLSQPADTFFVTVDYEGTPGNDGFGGFFFKNNYVFTIGQGLNSEPPSMLRYWVPSNDVPDDKATLDMRVTVPASLQAFSNGVLVSVETDGVGKTFHWREQLPIAPYLIAVAAGEYATIELPYRSVSGDTLPVQCFVYPDHLALAKIDFAALPNMLHIFENLFNPYPFARYSMVEADNRGAMEHQTMTTYSTQLITGDNRYDYIVAHELAHHWWGNLVTCGDWKDIWLNEGFATYSEALYFEQLYGKRFLTEYMNSLSQIYFSEVSRRGHMTVYNPSYKWGGTVYQKGAWVLHMLRRQLGDDVFFKTLRTFSQTFAYGNALTADFISICENESGRDLHLFFDQWLYQPGYPDLDIAWFYEKTSEGWYRVTAAVEQKQWDRFKFRIPVEIVLTTDHSALKDTLKIEGRETRFEWTVRGKPIALQIDPDNWLLKQYDLIETPNEPGFAPNTFVLAQNFPNPFRRFESTKIIFQTPTLGAPHALSLRIYNLLGQQVKSLIDAPVSSGINTVSWDGTDDRGRTLAAGVYLLRLSASGKILERKITLLDHN